MRAYIDNFINKPLKSGYNRRGILEAFFPSLTNIRKEDFHNVVLSINIYIYIPGVLSTDVVFVYTIKDYIMRSRHY